MPLIQYFTKHTQTCTYDRVDHVLFKNVIGTRHQCVCAMRAYLHVFWCGGRHCAMASDQILKSRPLTPFVGVRKKRDNFKTFLRRSTTVA